MKNSNPNISNLKLATALLVFCASPPTLQKIKQKTHTTTTATTKQQQQQPSNNSNNSNSQATTANPQNKHYSSLLL